MTKITNVSKRVRWSIIGYAAVSVSVIFFIASLVVVYALPRSNAFVERIADRSLYPVILIGYRDAISFRTLSDNMASIKRFYESQDFSQVGLRIDFSTEDGQKRFKVREKEVLNKMIEDEAIMLLAKDRGISITRDAASQGLRRKLEEYGSEDDVKQNLEKLYGWTLADFENKVVLPGLYEEKLRESFEKETDTMSRAKENIDAAQKALRTGTLFADAAKRYSEGQTAQDGGSLGWFTLSDLAPELRDPVSAQKIGVPGDIIESELGFHIVLIEEKKSDDGNQLYRLRQIFSKKVSFSDWLTEQMKTLSFYVLSPDYQWNADEARVEFRNQEMLDFEKELYDKANGDAMFFF